MAIGRNKASVRIFLCLALLLFVLQLGRPLAGAEKENSSDPSVAWSIGREIKGSDSAALLEDDGDEFTGGFSTLDSMLQWAIGHSDPEKLKVDAENTGKLSPEELLSKQSEIKELMEKLKMPSDAELMKIAIADLNNSSSSPQERLRALNELLVLVEPVDNALDMDKLGGLAAVIKELGNVESEIRTASAWVLGKASQNNAIVQNQILGYGALPILMKMVNSSYTEEAIKAFYAVSALVRNNERGQELFFLEGGDMVLQDMLTNSTIDMRLQKKVVLLVTDLADYQVKLMGPNGKNNNLMLSLTSNRVFLKSVVDLSVKPDLDLQEKVLLAVRSLLHLASIEAGELKEFCSLDLVLDKIRIQLEALTSDEDLADFAKDVETLRREVQSSFLQKLEQATTNSQ